MDDFRFNLILKYLYDTRERYDLEKLCAFLGFTFKTLEMALKHLKSENKIDYLNGLLQITAVGYGQLQETKFLNYDFGFSNNPSEEIEETSNTIYFPKGDFLD